MTALGLAGLAGRLMRRRDRAQSAAPGYTLGVDPNGRDVTVRFGLEGGRHMLVLGASGAGKSHALMWIARRHIAAGFGCVVIDLKADRALAEQIEHEAVVRGRPFHCWTLDGGDRWNPLAHGNASELKDKLIASERFSEPHYQRMYERYLLSVLRVLEESGTRPSIDRVVGLLDPDVLLGALRDVPDERVADDVGRYLDGLGPDQRRHLSGLADRLALLVEAGHGRHLVESDDPAETIDLQRTLARGGVVVFSLNSSRYPETARLVGNLAVQDLTAVCGALEAAPDRKRAALVAIDEFSALASDRVAALFQRARSARCSLLVATQEIADLRRVGRAFDEQVIGNVELVLAGRQNNPASAEIVSALAGGADAWQHTFHERGGTSWRLGRERLVTPDDVARLGVGEAILIEKNPHRVERVSVAAPATAPVSDTAWFAARRARLRLPDAE